MADFKDRIQQWKWIGSGRDSDDTLKILCDHFLATRRDIVVSSLPTSICNVQMCACVHVCTDVYMFSHAHVQSGQIKSGKIIPNYSATVSCIYNFQSQRWRGLYDR